MSSDDRVNPLTESTMTIPSDSEQYSGNDDISPSPPSSSSSPPMILYTPPTFWGLLRGAAINLLLPFINGLMLGFGELFAHEAAFRLGWGGTKVGLLYRRVVQLDLGQWQTYFWHSYLGNVSKLLPVILYAWMPLTHSFAGIPNWPKSSLCRTGY
jgi:Outer membrane protein TOM13